MKIPAHYCTEKRILNEFRDNWRKAKMAGETEKAEEIAKDWQQAAKEYQAVHRLLDIYKGAIKYNPLYHSDPIFTDPENQPMTKRGD